MKRVRFKTFGCKLNQSESAALVADFEARGYRVVDEREPCDVFLLNTCTVTGRSDAKCRQAVRQVLRENPKATVLVVGCYPQVDAQKLATIEGVDYIFGTQEKHRLFDYFPGPGKVPRPVVVAEPVMETREAISLPGHFRNQTRAFLKIQDGCGRFCSYCIVPYARGASRTVASDTILEQARDLIRKGFQEIVLTGVHIGEYGKELESGLRLPELIQQVASLEGLGRIRLSSLNSDDLTDELMDVLAGSPKICRHFHIPLQSGSDAILKAMNRGYDTEDFRNRIGKLINAFPDAGFGTDIIVGFPGETDALFEETAGFVTSLPFTYFHVFPYSIRKGTPAATFPGQVDAQVKRDRAARLRNIGEAKKRAFYKKWIGCRADVLFESRNQDGLMSGFSSEYVRISSPFDQRFVNQIVPVTIKGTGSGTLKGEIIE